VGAFFVDINQSTAKQMVSARVFVSICSHSVIHHGLKIFSICPSKLGQRSLGKYGKRDDSQFPWISSFLCSMTNCVQLMDSTRLNVELSTGSETIATPRALRSTSDTDNDCVIKRIYYRIDGS
jgi:hypothetical protein